MKVPFSWLKQYVDIDVTAQELEDKLFGCGFEVEELIDLGGEISKVVVGVVTECVPQEGTHLHICKVDCDEYGHDIQISTGAPNVYAGMHTAAALDGSTLPGGVKIKAKPLMGVESNGMLCSGEELGLNDDLYPGAEVYGLLDLPKDTVPGTPIQQVVGLDDYIFDISITANRADCQSVLGIAREVAAVLNKPLKMPATDYTVSDYVDSRLSISVEAETLAFYADADLDMLHIAADAPERKVIRILNPISSHLTIMRPLLAPSLLNVVVDNLRKGNAEGRLFEMSNIYIPKQLPVTELPEERLHLGFAAWGSEEDFFAVKGAVESFGAAFGVELTVERATDVAWLHPGIAAYILCKGERVGVFGKLANDVTSELKLPKDSRANLNIYLGEIDWVAFHALVPAAIHYQPIPEFAPVQRDLALVAPESMECGTLVTEMQRACKQLTKVELFDIYRGEKLGADKKSMAFSLSFQPADKPLTPDEIDRFVKKILGNLKFKLGIEIRE